MRFNQSLIFTFLDGRSEVEVRSTSAKEFTWNYWTLAINHWTRFLSELSFQDAFGKCRGVLPGYYYGNMEEFCDGPETLSSQWRWSVQRGVGLCGRLFPGALHYMQPWLQSGQHWGSKLASGSMVAIFQAEQSCVEYTAEMGCQLCSV